MSTTTDDPAFTKALALGLLRSAFVSLFWAVIAERKKRPGGFTLQALAKSVGVNKGEVSRWFNGDPNWTVNTIATIAHALRLKIEVQATDLETGEVYTPAGRKARPMVISAQNVRIRKRGPDDVIVSTQGRTFDIQDLTASTTPPVFVQLSSRPPVVSSEAA